MSRKTVEINELTLALTPNLIVDDINANIIELWLSPEIPLQAFHLTDMFDGMSFKRDCKAEWVSVLREIADKLESR